MTLTQDFDRYNSRRRFPDWKPEDPYSPYHEQNPTSTLVIRRMLAMLDLELTVGEWVKQALAAANLPEVLPYVERNSSDEQRHDLALRKLARYVGGAIEDKESRAIVSEWQQQQPSFSLAYALEMGVFFTLLPALVDLGDMYCIKVSQWISDDEGVHVLVNGRLAKELGERLSKDHCSLVVATIEWVFRPLGSAAVRKLQERALRRLTSGSDPDMMRSSVPVTPAFFEQVDKRSIVY